MKPSYLEDGMIFKKQQTKHDKRRFEDQMGPEETVVASDATIKGTLTGNKSFRIEGHIEGKIKSDGILWIDAQGCIEGPVHARGVIVEGTMKGDIVSIEKTELRSGCHVTGDITCGAIAVAEDCFFQGQIQMKSKEDQPYTFVNKRKSL
jgi:cytoskeletal protein CcmA (bactofilin family)